MKTSIIFNPFFQIPKSEKSHVRGQAECWAVKLEAEISTKEAVLSDYNDIYIDHGANFNKTLNLFGGLNETVYLRFCDLIEAVEFGSNLHFLQLSNEECGYIESIKKRLGVPSTHEGFTEEFVDKIEEMFTNSNTVTMGDLNLKSAIIGDSHSLAYSDCNDAIFKTNGLTLFSALKTGLERLAMYQTGDISKYSSLTFCLGSIDIRFHACKEGNIGFEHLLSDYLHQIKMIKREYGIEVNVCLPVPIESESRKIPKTGQYKGVNFNGSIEQRKRKIMEFEDCFYFEDIDIISPPQDWYTMEPTEYETTYMELSSSVHIAPRWYRQTGVWNV